VAAICIAVVSVSGGVIVLSEQTVVVAGGVGLAGRVHIPGTKMNGVAALDVFDHALHSTHLNLNLFPYPQLFVHGLPAHIERLTQFSCYPAIKDARNRLIDDGNQRSPKQLS